MLNFVRISSFELPQQYHLRKCCVETSTVVFAISTITTSLRRPRPSDHRIDAGRSPGSCEAARASVDICRTRPWPVLRQTGCASSLLTSYRSTGQTDGPRRTDTRPLHRRGATSVTKLRSRGLFCVPLRAGVNETNTYFTPPRRRDC